MTYMTVKNMWVHIQQERLQNSPEYQKKLVSEYANAFSVYKNRWRFELSSEDFFDWKREWDRVRKKILRSYGRAV